MKLLWKQTDQWSWTGYSQATGMHVCRVNDYKSYTRLTRQEPDDCMFDFISPEHARAWAEQWYNKHVSD